MKANREKLRAAMKNIKKKTPLTGVAGLLSRIHRGELGRKIPIQSAPVLPVPYVAQDQWALLTLLALPTGPQSNEWNCPWGAIRWSPVTDGHGQLQDLRSSAGDKAIALKDQLWSLDRSQLSMLIRSLDRLLKYKPSEVPDMKALAKVYHRLYPQELLDLVCQIEPSSQAWLKAGDA